MFVYVNGTLYVSISIASFCVSDVCLYGVVIVGSLLSNTAGDSDQKQKVVIKCLNPIGGVSLYIIT